MKFKQFNLEMANLYFRDKAKEKGWEEKRGIFKVLSVLMKSYEYNILWKILQKKYVYLRQVEFVLTTRCSLRCRECANLMQYYEKPYEIDTDIINNAFDNLFKVVDEIQTVVLVGGEPFLYKGICDVIWHMVGEGKVKHIHIYTNGTIIPNQITFEALREKKVKIIISDYGEVSRNKNELFDKCVENHVDVYMKNEDLIWGYVGNMERRGRSEKALQTQFENCNNYCRSILNGRLYYCPRAGHGHDLNLVNTGENEYIDLINGEITSDMIINIVYSDHFFSACDFCNYGTKDMTPIIPGEQMEKNEKKDIS